MDYGLGVRSESRYLRSQQWGGKCIWVWELSGGPQLRLWRVQHQSDLDPASSELAIDEAIAVTAILSWKLGLRPFGD